MPTDDAATAHRPGSYRRGCAGPLAADPGAAGADAGDAPEHG
ncbi:hypothetical protein [Micromonospora zhanjiangensis]